MQDWKLFEAEIMSGLFSVPLMPSIVPGMKSSINDY